MAEQTLSSPPSADDWLTALRVLKQQLDSNGVVSSVALRTALEKEGAKNARQLVVRLKYYDFSVASEEGLEPPTFRWKSHGRSFYTEESYLKLQSETQDAARVAERAAEDAPEQTEEAAEAETPRERRTNRQEEGRLGAYVVTALEGIYQSEHTPDDCPYAFDVHSERAGGDFENVDALAVHWRSERVVELVSVEVKLDFTARLIQQAKNYMRFSDRVWVAVPVLAEASDASAALREYDALLFEHAIDCGLGILACRRRPGRSYEVVPVQWPRKLNPDAVEKEQFLERYRRVFEKAGVVAPKSSRRYPGLA